MKEADVVFHVPLGHEAWSTDLHEPLIVALCLPFLRKYPWKLKGTPRILAMGGELRSLLEEKRGNERTVLRELLQLQKQLATMPEGVVSKLLYLR